MKNINYNLNILKNKKKRNNKQQYYIRINEGEKSSKNLLFTNDEFKFNKKNILKQELKEEDLIHYQNLIIDHKYDNLYDFFKYIFNNNNISDKNNDGYFINIYKDAINIFNINKKNYMKKFDIIDKYSKAIKTLNKNIIKLNQRIKNKKNILENKKKLKIEIQKRYKITDRHDNFVNQVKKLMKFKGIQNNSYQNDIDIVNNVSYFKINNKNMKKDLDNIKKNKIKIQKRY